MSRHFIWFHRLAFLAVALNGVQVAWGAGWHDNFNDGNVADGTPVTWVETTPGVYDAATGDYLMSLPGGSDNDILLPVVDVELANTFVRTQAAVMKGPGGESGGTMGVVARWEPSSFDGYAAILSNGGHLELLRLDGGAITTLDEIRGLPIDTARDAVIELGIVDDLLQVFLYRPGDAKPADPVLEVADGVYLTGRAGIVYNENDDNTLGRFRFAEAQDTPLASIVWGDLDGDGAVDAGDAGILFADWGTDKYPADINADGIADAADAGIMFANWTGDAAISSVPEPAVGGPLFAILLSALTVRARRS